MIKLEMEKLFKVAVVVSIGYLVAVGIMIVWLFSRGI